MYVPAAAREARHVQAIEFAVSNPVSCAPATTVARALTMMRATLCDCLPVVDAEGRLMGLVTRRDLVQGIICFQEPASEIPVVSVMSKPLYTLPADSSLADAAELIMKHRVRRIPLVDGHRKLIALLSLSDLAVAEPRIRLSERRASQPPRARQQ